METMKAVFSGSDFKEVVSRISKIPSLGPFIGSELLNLEVADGVCKASSFGIILSVTVAAATGSLPLCCIDERLLGPFSQVSEEAKNVAIEIKGKEIHLTNSRGRRVTAPFEVGKKFEIPIPDVTPIHIDKKLGKRIGYLSGIAFSDVTMQHLNCVYVTSKLVVAVNQKCMAIVKMLTGVKENIAIPIPVARLVEEGYTLYVSPQQTVAKNGVATYAMPSPTEAQDSFPIKVVTDYSKAEKTEVAKVNGKVFSALVGDCSLCLSGISRVDVILIFTATKDGRLRLQAANGGAKFDSYIKTTSTATEAALYVPLEEIDKALPFLEDQKEISLHQGKKGEAYLVFLNGMLIYPKYGTKKKK